MKRCARCRTLKPVEEFRVKNRATGLLTSYCILCIRANSKDHYEKNKASYIARARAASFKTRERNMRLVVEYLRSHPCVDCGEADTAVLEFDHIGEKRFDVSAKLSHYAWETLLEEIERCEVVCANCHRRRTAKRAGFIRALLGDSL